MPKYTKEKSRYNVKQYMTVQYYQVKHITIHFSSTIHYDEIHNSTLQCSADKYNTIHHHYGNTVLTPNITLSVDPSVSREICVF